MDKKNSRNSRFCKTALKALFCLSLVGSVAGNASAQKILKGSVKNEKGEALLGVTVMVKGTSVGVITDVEGNYKLNVPKENDNGELLFSFMGYEPYTQSVSSDTTDIVLKEDLKALGEVVVSTQKRTQTSIEVPVSVSALNGERLTNLSIKQMDEMSSFIPGLQVQLQSPNNPGYVIRGVTSDGMASYSQPRISVFMDGVSISRTQASVVELYDMERVEVVKGPQGTLFGRGAEIGAMHFITNKPTNKLSGELKLEYGSYNQRSAEGFVNTPITDKVANRLAFSYDAHDGYIKNAAGGTLNGKSALAVRNSTRWITGDNSSLKLIIDYQHDDYPGTCFKSNRLALPEGGDTSPYTTAYLNGGENLGITRDNGGATLQFDQNFSPSLSFNSITGFRAYKSDEYFDADGTYLPLLDCEEASKGTQFSQEFRLNWNNGGKVTGFVGASYFYEHSQETVVCKSDLQYTFPMVVGSALKAQMSQLPAQVVGGVNAGLSQFAEGLKAQYPDYSDMIDQMVAGLSSQVSENLSAQMNTLVGNWFSSNTWTSTPNFYGDTENAVNTVLTEALTKLVSENPYASALLGGADPATLVQSMDIASSLSALQNYSGISLPEDYQENYTNYANNQAADIFADLSWNIYKNLSLTVGLRGTYEHQESGYSSTSDIAPLVGAILYTTSNGEKVWASDNYCSWVGRLALNYMFKRNNLYASVSRGRRPGVIYFDCNPDDIVTLKPEIIVSYELGIKGSVLNNHLAYDFTTFYYDWSHFQSSRLESKDNGAKTYRPDDAGKAHSIGVEAGLRYSFMNMCSIFGNYAYIDGKFNETDGNGNEQEMAGNRFRLTPKHSFAMGLDVNIPIRSNLMFYFRPSYSYKSKVYFENENTELLSQDGYGLANVNSGFVLKGKALTYDLGFFGKNIFDKEYLIDAGNTGNEIGFPTFIAGAPAVYGVSVKLSF